ncbi:tape measure protein [Corynebacterium sp. KPL2825]|uniref:tape measure protein n=1 Tax=Corynebacterium sp. KPL2825 TaxID=3135444 RepID=UPI0030C98D79
MAALDLGDLGFTIKVDTGDFDSKMGQVERKARQVDQSLEKTGNKKIKPTADTSDIDKVERSARKADSALDKTSSKKVTPRGDASGLDTLGTAASKVSSELDKASSKKVSPKSDSAPLERTSRAADDASSNIDKAAASADKASESFSQAGSSTDGFASKLRGTVGKLGGFAAGVAGVAGAAEVMQNGFAKVTSIEDTTQALGVMMGSADKASGFMDKLVASNMKSTYSFDAWANAGKTLVAFGVDAEQASNTVTALGEAAAATGKGEEALLSMSDAFGQAAASGNISMETLNRLADGGVQGLTILANHFGVTTDEMQKMISKGAVPAQEGIKALTDGIIKGSDGAAGKVESLSGVMGKMAETTSGTLKNMGAELNNTAAAIFEKLSPAIKAGADKVRVGAQNLTAWIKDVDVSPLVKMGEAVTSLPGPVNDLAKAFVALKVAQAALNSQMGQSAISKVTSLKESISDFGSTMGSAYTAAATSGKKFAKTTGVVKASMAGIKTAANGVMGALGGPWGVAFMGAAATVSAVSSAHDKAKSVQEAYSQSTRDAAQAQDQLNASLAGTSEKLNDTQLKMASTMVEKDLGQMKTMAEEYSGFINAVEAPDLSWWKQGRWSSEWREYNNQVNESKDAYAAIEKAAGELKIPMEDLNRVVAEGGPQYDKLMASLRSGGDASQAAADQLGEARDNIRQSVEAARELDPAAAQAAAGISTLADSSASAEDKLSALKSTMQAMGLMAQTADEANMQAAESIEELGNKMEGLVNQDIGIGSELFDGDKLNYTNENARALSDTLSSMSDELMNVAIANGDVQGIWEMMGPQLDTLREQMGLAGAEFDEQWSHVLESYGLAPDVIHTLVELDGASEAVQSLGDVWAAMYPLEEGTTVNIDPPEPAVLAAMDELGIKYQEIKNDAGEVIQYKVTAPNDEVMADLQSITTKMAEIDDESISIETIMDTTPIQIGKSEADALLRDLDIQNPSPTAQLVIDELLANGQIARGDLEYLNQQSAHPSADLDKTLLDAGVNTAHSQLQGVDDHNTTSDIRGNNSDLSSKVNTAINLINSVPSVKVVRFIGEKVGNWVGGLFGHEHGGRIGLPGFAAGGEIPGLAVGGFPNAARTVGNNAGYKLPTTGPGTEQVDGFLGVDNMGRAVARVNAGEWVINNNSSEDYNRTLQGINAGNPRMILAGLATELPALADGGRTKSAEVIEQLQPYNNGPYVMGGFSPSSMDCSGAVSAAVNTWLGLNPFDSRMSTVTEGSWLAAKGFKNGRGNGSELVVGWYDYGGGANGHTAMMLPDGTFIESGGNTGQGFTIGGAAGPLDGRGFTNFMYLPGSDDGELTGDGGVTMNGNGTDLSISDFGGASGGGGGKRASHKSVSAPSVGKMFDAPGFASNVPGATVGGGLSRGQRAQAYAYGQQAGLSKAQIDGALDFANPFVGQQSFRQEMGEPAAKQVLSIAKQLEKTIGRGGIAAQVESALDAKTPNWDVWLRVNDETLDAFNALGEAQADRKNASMDITEAEEKLAELRKKASKSDEESTEKLAEAYKNLDKAKGKELTKSYTADKKAEDIEKAEKKIRELKDKTSENEVKAAQQIAEAEQDLVDAREEEKRAIREVEQAQLQYNTALTMAPIKAVASLTDHIADGLGTVADTLGIMAENMEHANSVADARQKSELDNISAQRSAMNAASKLRELEREGANERHAETLNQQQAEFDLAMARHDYNSEYADLEINLAELRTKGILDVSQRALDTDRLAMISASSVAVAEKQLELSRAQAAQNEFNRRMQIEEATYELNYQEEMARIQHERLEVATREMANAAAEAANTLGASASALAREQQGKQKQAKGAAGVIAGLAQLAGAGAITAASGGAAVPAAIGLGVAGLASLVQGSTSIVEGRSQEKAYKEQAREEYDKLSRDDKRRVDAARAGLVVGALAGGGIGAAGGTSDDVGSMFDATSGAFNLPLYKKQMEQKYGAEAAELLTNKAKAELDRRERKAEIEKARAEFDLHKENDPQAEALAEMQNTLQRQLDELQQENKQLAGVNDKLDQGNKSVLMSIGGSGWGADATGGMMLSKREQGFGNISREDVGEWSSLNVENGWLTNGLMRPIVDSVADTAADAAAAGRDIVEGLPETVVDGLYARQLSGSDVVPGALDAARRSSMANEEARRQAAYQDAASRVLSSMGGDTTNIDTQFTGAVTVNAQLEDKVMAGLSSMVKQR